MEDRGPLDGNSRSRSCRRVAPGVLRRVNPCASLDAVVGPGRIGARCAPGAAHFADAMKIDARRFLVPEGGSVDLARWPTRVDAYYDSHEDYERALAQHVATLAEGQTVLYAHDRYALLIVFQAMDAAGKDGVIKHVMSGVNPQEI